MYFLGHWARGGMPKKKVLLIEDDQALSRMISRFLETVGFDVLMAFDGQDGLDKSFAEHPDVVLLDLGLPKMPGEEVCRRLRRDSRTAKIPIIMETAKAGDTDRIVGRVIGADAYLTKPYALEELLDKVLQAAGSPAGLANPVLDPREE
jgi:DNA-binding response OmpR family regulator